MLSFGQNLRAWRNYSCLSQTELAKRSKISRPNWVAIEQGRKDLNLSTLYRIAQALNLTPGKLLDESPPTISLNRYQIDRIAKAVLSDQTLKDPQERALAYAATRHLTHFLSALGRNPKKILKSLKTPGKKSSLHSAELQPLFSRIHHLAPSFVENHHV